MSSPVARTVKDFCCRYGIGKSLAYELKDAGELIFIKVGVRTLVDEESAKAWYSKQPRMHAPTYTITPETGGSERKSVETKNTKHKLSQRGGGRSRKVAAT